MRSISAAIESAYNAWGQDRKYTAFMLCELIGPAATYRYTDAPVPVVWNGFTWSNISFKISDITVDGEGEVGASVMFEDVSRTIRSLAFANDMNQFQIRVSEVWADETNSVFGQDIVIHGTCDGVSCQGEDTPNPTAQISIRGVHASTSQVIGPTQEYTKNCRYERFKGEQCKYVGAATFCDRTYANCTTLGNTKNFGGFRFALEEGQVVQWGAKTTTTQKRPAEPYDPNKNKGGTATAQPPARRRAAGR